MSSDDDKQPVATARLPQIYAAMNAALKQVRPIYKDRVNQQQRFNFRSVDDVYLALRPALEDHGVTILPLLEQVHYDVVETNKGKAMNYCRVTVRYRFVALDGSYVEACAPGEGMDSADKATAKAMSVAYKTAMFQTFCIPCEEGARDRDGDYTDPMPEGRAPAAPDTGGFNGADYCTDQQLEQLEAAGLAYCEGNSGNWRGRQLELARWASNNGCDRLQDLSPDEADRAIEYLNGELNKRPKG